MAQYGPFPDANTFPYPRLRVPVIRSGSNYPRYTPPIIEYETYEKERIQIGDSEHLVWKLVRHHEQLCQQCGVPLTSADFEGERCSQCGKEIK